MFILWFKYGSSLCSLHTARIQWTKKSWYFGFEHLKKRKKKTNLKVNIIYMVSIFLFFFITIQYHIVELLWFKFIIIYYVCRGVFLNKHKFYQTNQKLTTATTEKFNVTFFKILFYVCSTEILLVFFFKYSSCCSFCKSKFFLWQWQGKYITKVNNILLDLWTWIAVRIE